MIKLTITKITDGMSTTCEAKTEAGKPVKFSIAGVQDRHSTPITVYRLKAGDTIYAQEGDPGLEGNGIISK